jgi:hypothetical protein
MSGVELIGPKPTLVGVARGHANVNLFPGSLWSAYEEGA